MFHLHITKSVKLVVGLVAFSYLANLSIYQSSLTINPAQAGISDLGSKAKVLVRIDDKPDASAFLPIADIRVDTNRPKDKSTSVSYDQQSRKQAQNQLVKRKSRRQSSIAGVWNSSEGPISFRQSGSNVVGSYPRDNGVIEGRISSNVLTGYWTEDASNRRCSTPRNGRYHWGRIRFSFDGSSFAGLWSYCDDKPASSWTGTNSIAGAGNSSEDPSDSQQNSIAGVWNSSEGPISFRQSESNVSGSYPNDNGVIEGLISSNVLTGYWTEDASDRRCSAPRNGRYHWGRIRFSFDGSSFAGLWSYCDDEPTSSWTGTRK